MESKVCIDGREVPFKATAAIPRLYRMQFQRDIMRDMTAIQKDIESAKETGDLSVSSLEMFENVAYVMAKHADPEGVPASIDEWLDGFDTFSIYKVFPAIAALWRANLSTSEESKKK